jgi:hypothetical protein
MRDSVSAPDRSSGTTDSVQHSNQTRLRSGTRARRPDGGELSPEELAHLFTESRTDIEETTATISRRGDALAAQSHAIAEKLGDENTASDTESDSEDLTREDLTREDLTREDLNALSNDLIEAVADVERLSSDLHALLTAVEEARAYLETADE